MKSLNWFKFVIDDLPVNCYFCPEVLEQALKTMDYEDRCLYINSYIDYVISWYLLKKVTEAKNDYEWLGLEMHFVNMYQEEWHRNHLRFVQYVFWKSWRRTYDDDGTLYVDPTFEENEPWDYSEPVSDSDLTYPRNNSVK